MKEKHPLLLENGLQILDCKNHNPYFVLSTSEIPLKIYKVFNLDSYFNAQTFFSLFQA
jgi:hypothetical protein